MRSRRVAAAARIAKSLVRRRLGLHHVTVPYEHSGGVIVADLTTPQGLEFYRYGGFPVADLSVLEEVLRPGDIFVDGGANSGLYALVGARQVGAGGHVLAFEPAPGTRLALMRNVVANSLTQVTVLPQALGSANSQLPFVVMGHGGGLSSFAPANPQDGKRITVDVMPLDDAIPSPLRSRVRLVKLDLEGAEVAALDGCSRLLRDVRPWFLVEVEDDHLQRQGSSADAVFALFEKYDYRVQQPRDPGSRNFLFSPTEKSSAARPPAGACS